MVPNFSAQPRALVPTGIPKSFVGEFHSVVDRKAKIARRHYSNVIYMNGGEQPRSILVHMTRHIQAASCAQMRIYCGGNAHEKTKTDFCGCGTLWWPYSDRCTRDANRTNPSRHGCTGRASALGLRPLSVLVATKLLRGLRRLFVLPTPPLSPLLASPSLLVMFRGGANTPPLSF